MSFNEQDFGIAVEWTTIQTEKPVGLVGFDALPRDFIQISREANRAPPVDNLSIILFPSKLDSTKFASTVSKEIAQQYSSGEVEIPREQSRYMVLQNEQGRRFFLLNMGALSRDSVLFLTHLVPRTFSELERISAMSDNAFRDSAAMALWDYNKKFGIPFMRPSQHVSSFVRILAENLRTQFAEFLALKSSISEDNLYSAKDFFDYRLSLLLEGVLRRGKYDFFDVVGGITNYIQTIIILSATQAWPGLHTALSRRFDYNDSKLRKSLSSQPDLIEALDVLKTELTYERINTTYDKFSISLSKSMTKAFDKLRPQYVWLDGILALMEVGGRYSSEMVGGKAPTVRGFGTLDDFLRMASRIFRRRDVYPEVPIMAGTIMVQLLMSKLLYDFDWKSFRKAVSVARRRSSRIDEDLAIIKKKNPKTALKYEDAALDLITLSKMAETHGMRRKALQLRKEADKVVTRHHLLVLELTLAWADYVRTFDSTFLRDIYQRYESIRQPRYLESNPHLAVIAEVVRAIFEPERREEHLSAAEAHAGNMLVSLPQDKMGYGRDLPAITIVSSEILFHFIEMMRDLLRVSSSTGKADMLEAIRKANIEAIAIKQLSHPGDPLINVAIRTELIFCLVTNRFTEVEEKILLLESRTESSNSLRDSFAAIRWWTASTSGVLQKYLEVSKFKADSHDVWDIMATNFIASELERELENTILGSKAIVFVEGDTDELVFRQFAKKVIPVAKLGILATDGWTNMKYYPETKLAKATQIPAFCIFDGDTSRRHELLKVKQTLMQGLGIPIGRFKTLESNTIENYLLVPAAIKRAFTTSSVDIGEISTFIDRHATRRNKKTVLENLLRTLQVGRYDKIIAEKIASSMSPAEIDPEIHRILKEISRQGFGP